MKKYNEHDQQWIEQRIIEAEQIMEKHKDCTNWERLPKEVLDRVEYLSLKVFEDINLRALLPEQVKRIRAFPDWNSNLVAH